MSIITIRFPSVSSRSFSSATTINPQTWSSSYFSPFNFNILRGEADRAKNICNHFNQVNAMRLGLAFLLLLGKIPKIGEDRPKNSSNFGNSQNNSRTDWGSQRRTSWTNTDKTTGTDQTGTSNSSKTTTTSYTYMFKEFEGLTSKSEITKVYRNLARVEHPDKHFNSEESNKKFKKLGEDYQYALSQAKG